MDDHVVERITHLGEWSQRHPLRVPYLFNDGPRVAECRIDWSPRVAVMWVSAADRAHPVSGKPVVRFTVVGSEVEYVASFDRVAHSQCPVCQVIWDYHEEVFSTVRHVGREPLSVFVDQVDGATLIVDRWDSALPGLSWAEICLWENARNGEGESWW